MKPLGKLKTRAAKRHRRHLRLRKRVTGTPERPRLVVFRSLKHVYAQVIDDVSGTTLAAADDSSKGLKIEDKGKISRSTEVGKLVAKLAKEKGIERVVFDRGGLKYHGRIKAVAEGAREAGLEL